MLHKYYNMSNKNIYENFDGARICIGGSQCEGHGCPSIGPCDTHGKDNTNAVCDPKDCGTYITCPNTEMCAVQSLGSVCRHFCVPAVKKSDYTNLQNQNSDEITKNQNLQDQLKKSQDQNSDEITKNQNLQDQLKKLQNQNSDEITKNQNLQNAINKDNKTVAAQTTQLNSLQQNIQKDEEKIKNQDATIKDQLNRIGGLEAKTQELMHDLISTESKLDETKSLSTILSLSKKLSSIGVNQMTTTIKRFIYR